MYADSRYVDIEKKCWYADIANADINIGTTLVQTIYTVGKIGQSLRIWKFMHFTNTTTMIFCDCMYKGNIDVSIYLTILIIYQRSHIIIIIHRLQINSWMQ